MVGLILAAGMGSRLSEMNLMHKCLAVVHNKYVICYSLDFLVGEDSENPLVDEIIIVVGHNKENIMETLGKEYRGVPICYVIQDEQKGVAHAVLAAKDFIHDDFIMCLSDEILLNPNLGSMIDFFHSSDDSCVCGCYFNPNDFSMKPFAYEVTDDNRIVHVTDKPSFYNNGYRGVGECIFKKECLYYLERLQPNRIGGELEMADWIQMIIDDNKSVRLFQVADSYVNINYKKDIEQATEMLNMV